MKDGMATQFVVKGGEGPPPSGTWSIQSFREGGVPVTGTTVHSEPEKTVAELAVWTASPFVRVTTVARILAAGGDVVPTRRNPMQPFHATVTGLSLEQLDEVFDPPIPSPVGPACDLTGRTLNLEMAKEHRKPVPSNFYPRRIDRWRSSLP